VKVKAGKDLRFWCQGKRVSETNAINVKVDHDIQVKLNNKSLIVVKETKKSKGVN